MLRTYFVELLGRQLGLTAVVIPVSLVVSVAQLVARRTHDRKVVGSIPTNAVCFTVVR